MDVISLTAPVCYQRSYTQNLSSGEIKDWKQKNKTFRPGIWTHAFCNTDALLYQLRTGHIVNS